MTRVIDRIMFVCTANECRSPFVEAYARRAGEGAPVRFESSGTEATGRAVPEQGLALAAEHRLSVAQHRSRQVDVAILADQDLILPMSRIHARELLLLAPAVAPRLFTLKQFARWIAQHPRPPRSHLGSWLDAAAADRPRTNFVGDDRLDDVADPVGRPMHYWRRMAEDVVPAIDAILDGLYQSGR
ncbi:protein-tyrosine-phosphatase [Microbacterium kribbense]|uniref:Protein-tyrosine-phosphatase n=1 Tax=Microbacterium kribbense TaxID=433645 RepID=A0ABP7FXJ0_9MICO